MPITHSLMSRFLPATTCAGSTISYQVASETVHTQNGRDTVNDTSDTLNQHRDAPVTLKATALNAANAAIDRIAAQTRTPLLDAYPSLAERMVTARHLFSEGAGVHPATGFPMTRTEDERLVLRAAALNSANATWLRKRALHSLPPLQSQDCVGSPEWVREFVTGADALICEGETS